MIKIYAAIAIIAVLAASAYGLVKYGRALERADNNEIIAELQNNLKDLGLAIQKQEGKAADNARKLVESDRERIDAIKTHDHQAAELKRLESVIRQEREKSKAKDSDKNTDDLHYRIIITNSTVRVWDEARSSSKLPASSSASVLQKRLSTITGDDINGVIKYAIGEYNRCAIKYNELWPACDRLISTKN